MTSPPADPASQHLPTLLAAPAMRQVRAYAMYFIDREGRTASWNEGVGEVLGWPERDWLGQPASVVFTPEDAAAGEAGQALRSAAEQGHTDSRRWMRRRDGGRFYAAGALTRVADASGQLLGYLQILRDCTPERAAEDEAERLLAAERAARADSERQAAELTAAIDAIPDGVYIGDANGINRCNQTGLAMLGATSLQDLRERIGELGRRFRVRHGRDGPLVAPEDLPFNRALRGEPAVLETWATNAATGEDVLIRGTSAPIVVDGRIVGAVAVNTDLTERVKLQQKEHELSRVESRLRERDEELRALTAGVRDYAIFTIDLEGCISSWHEGAALMKGYTAEEAIGMPYAELFTPEDRARGVARQQMEVAARTGEYKGEGERLRKDGTRFDAAVVLTALRGPDGQLLGYLKLTQDITQRRRAEREREEALHAAESARAEAQRSSQAMSDFLATISHELRTPLSAILGWAHVLERGLSDPQGVRQALAAITRNARAQVQLIDDLLDMNRIETGQLRLEMQPVALAGVIAAAVDAVLPMATGRGIELRTQFDPDAGLVMGDPERLQQVVWNLLTNAVKFTPEGGTVTASLAPGGSALEVRVSDTGQGIAPEFLPRMFVRFQQQDGTTTRRHGGLGIGLAIVRQIAMLHGGSVRAESPGPGQGSTFIVRLPAYRPPTAKAWRDAGAASAAGDEAARRLDGVSVLLVDDEADGREIAAYVLRAAGARVLTAASAQEGFALLRSQGADAVLCDIGMPVHDGYEFIRWLRSLDAQSGRRTPAAAFTAYARPEDRRRALDAGYAAQLVKPIEPVALVAAVASLVARET